MEIEEKVKAYGFKKYSEQEQIIGELVSAIKRNDGCSMLAFEKEAKDNKPRLRLEIIVSKNKLVTGIIFSSIPSNMKYLFITDEIVNQKECVKIIDKYMSKL